MNLRLDKYLADFTELTRSQAKKEIREGRVQVNGETAKTGNDKVAFSDSVLWDGREIRGQQYQYIMLNKPAGIISSTMDDRDETVVEYIRKRSPVGSSSVPEHGGESVFLAKDLFPMGRLDKDTEGLLILTNDGELAQRLTHPREEVEKTYHVWVQGPVEGAAERLSRVTDLEGEPIRPARVETLRQGGETAKLSVTIHEGKNRQVRRMCAACGLEVKRLRRVREHTLELGSLPPGKWRRLTEAEVRALKAAGR